MANAYTDYFWQFYGGKDYVDSLTVSTTTSNDYKWIYWVDPQRKSESRFRKMYSTPYKPLGDFA